MGKYADEPHPLRLAGLVPDDGRWVAHGEVVLWWDREAMDWRLAVKLDGGREIATRFDWRDLRLFVEQA